MFVWEAVCFCMIFGHSFLLFSCGMFHQRLSQIQNAAQECSISHTFLFSLSLRWMYWTDWEEDPTESNRGKIKKAWMDGSHHQVFLTSKTVLWPNGLSLDIPQGILYWVDAYYDRIELIYLNTTERKVGFFLRICCIYNMFIVNQNKKY